MLAIVFNLVPPFSIFLVVATLLVLMVVAALFIFLVVAALFIILVVAALFIFLVVAVLFLLMVVAALFTFLVVATLSVFMVVAIVEVTSVFFVALGLEVALGSRDVWSFGVVLEFVVVLELRLVSFGIALVIPKVTSANSRSKVNNDLNIIFLFQNNIEN